MFRSSRSSPMHRIGSSPAARQALSFLLTISLVSPMTWRRSLWPMMTATTPTSLSMVVESSPVNAPFASQWTSWAPSLMGLPSRTCRTTSNPRKGGQTRTSGPPALSPSSLRSPAARSRASLRSPFIFQFPAMIGGRMGTQDYTEFTGRVNSYAAAEEGGGGGRGSRFPKDLPSRDRKNLLVAIRLRCFPNRRRTHGQRGQVEGSTAEQGHSRGRIFRRPAAGGRRPRIRGEVSPRLARGVRGCPAAAFQGRRTGRGPHPRWGEGARAGAEGDRHPPGVGPSDPRLRD